MRITFCGAAGGVTGSKHLIEFGDKKILLDCGFFQGPRLATRERNTNFGFRPDEIDAVILSHAHLDHCGLLPLLVKQGFTGSIFSTPATRDVARRMLEDAASIQEMDYAYLKKHGNKRSERLAKPIYTSADIAPVIRRFVTLPYARQNPGWQEIMHQVRLKFYDAGHILGSAVSVLECKSGFRKMRIAYTGDLGRRQSPILHNPGFIKDKVEVMICESTYGDHQHGSLQEAKEELAEIIGRLAQTKGKLIVPAFSLGRTQEFVYILHHLTDTGRIPRIPIWVDSPLAGRVTEVFRKYRDDYDLESSLDFPRSGDVPLAFRNLKYVKTRDESIRLNSAQGPVIIIAASGMAEGGRVLHHLRHSLGSPKNIILFTGYQAEQTLGRRILDGVSPVRIFNRYYQVRSRVEVLNELSAHADGPELVEYIMAAKGLKKIFLVHGESDRAKELKNLILEKSDLEVLIPEQGESFEV